MKEAPDELAQACLLESQRKESGEWLHAPPMLAIAGPEEPVRLLRFWLDQYLKLQQ